MSRATLIAQRYDTLVGIEEDTTTLQSADTIELEEGLFDPSIFKAIFLAGGPGSGKSFVADKTTSGQGFKVVNSDDAFEFFMKKAGVSLDMTGMTPAEVAKKDAIRAKAKRLTDLKMDLYLDGRLGLIIDGTGRSLSKIKGQREDLAALGYDTFMIYVNTSLEVALERNQKRARKVDPTLVRKFWQDVQDNVGGFQQTFKRNFAIIDNSSYENQAVIDDIWKQVAKFSKQKIQSKIAREWIKSETNRRKR
jgi:dephospho-CoA kinase